jgi:uncharacterized protein with PIN domain
MATIEIRFYEELNDFLPVERKKVAFSHTVQGRVSVKDLIESLGVPHTEIDLILVNGKSVDFSCLVQDGDRISVYPVFEALDISPVLRLRPKPLRGTRFVTDIHLGKLARYLRMLGFDTLYRNDYSDDVLARISSSEGRILLTRDCGLLKRNEVTHGYWVRLFDPLDQLEEVVRRLDLYNAFSPFTRCLECNGMLEPVEKESIIDRLPPGTRNAFNEFDCCRDCRKVYWRGSHYDRMRQLVDRLCQQREERSDCAGPC